VENRIGPESGAWSLVGEALAVERHVQFPPKRLRRDLEELAGWLAARGRAGDPVVRQRLAELAVDVMEAEVLAYAVVDAMTRGKAHLAAASACERVVLTVPFAHHDAILGEIAGALAGKILVDVTVPLRPPRIDVVVLPPGGSAAALAQKLLGSAVRVVSAFQN